MELNKVAIKVDGLHKSFKLPHEKQASLKSSLINFGKRGYEVQRALDNISFEIKHGEFFGIVGRNGSGKSTLLKILAGIYTPDSGSVQINGSLVPFIELGVGFNQELTGRENVFLNGSLLGFSRKEMQSMYKDIVEFAELEKFMDQKLKNYSSGMQVRLAFSIAIRARGDILLLDEVLAVGDSAFQKKCFEYFYELKDNNQTVIFVSHNMDQVVRFCDRALLLDGGKLIMTGSSDDVSDEYTSRNIVAEDKRLAKNSGRSAGSKLGKITSLKLLNATGAKIDSIDSGNAAKVRIGYQFDKKIGEFNIGLGLHHESNGYVFGYNTQMDNIKITKPKGIIELDLPKLPLLSGRYFFNVVAFGRDEAVPYDYLPKQLSFTVRVKPQQKLYRGVADLGHDWKVSG